MAKYVFITYFNEQPQQIVKDNLQKVCDRLTPIEIKPYVKHTIFKSAFSKNTFIAAQNDEIIKDTSFVEMGKVYSETNEYKSVGKDVPDGSYAFIRFNENNLEFFCDSFGSRTLWYYYDSEKIILSTSQRAITMLKGTYKVEKSTLSWFLSSGTQGVFSSWDSNIKMVLPRTLYNFNFSNWNLTEKDKCDNNYEIESNFSFKEIKEKFTSELVKNIVSSLDRNNPKEILLPLSGGNDSRLLLYLTEKYPNLSTVDLINWGVPSDGSVFNDKVASRKIAHCYKRKYLDIVIPSEVEDKDKLLHDFVLHSEGRIDHFNAYTDSFKFWSGLTQKGYKVVVRGDIPFTEGLDLNNIMARTHTGINKFTDYENYEDYDLNGFFDLQKDPANLNKKNRESYLQWRDRLYVSLRIPVVISTFNDITASYMESRSPIMSGKLFHLYSTLEDRKKGNKKIIVDLSKQLDKSGVSFAASPSIPNQANIFKNDTGIKFLKDYLEQLSGNKHFSSSLIASVQDKLEKLELKPNGSNTFVSKFQILLSENLPMRVKAYLKSKKKLHLDPITIAYRLVMVDKILKMYQNDSRYLYGIKNDTIGEVPLKSLKG
ncbi:hypothetical protein RM553_05490 [Zunongwangia sp. F363]|uniref:Asparagine synthetase domain-containing protein n=1 Tax=Autumnicola tepida TaxID=3075595 RepID=A0ABU3C7W4_9FLAO|nr:hypothetical protein [Zunongwangia sp. F363]MDT0642282.1 hypothetical protein [Zunongwangia sp. F363]